MNISPSLSLSIKQIWKLAYLCIICIQMLKHKLQMTFHFIRFLSCHSSLSVKPFHTGKFILKLDQNVHILIFFEISSAKKSNAYPLLKYESKPLLRLFITFENHFYLKFVMKFLARFMDRTQDCNIMNTKLQLEWRKLHRLYTRLYFLCFSKADFRKFIKVDNTKINNNGTYFRTMLTYWFEFQMLYDFVRKCTDAPIM